MSITLRPYQVEDTDKIRNLMLKGIKCIQYQLPTGGGKTLLTASMLKTATAKGIPSLFLVHRRELIKQSVEAFKKVGLHHGIIASGFYHSPKTLANIASVQTIGRRLHKIKEPQLIIWDESHHLAAGTWTKIYKTFPKAYHIGLSATPARTDGTGLNLYFHSMVNGPTVQWLIDNGFLAPYKLFAPHTVSVDGVHKRMGDFIQAELSAIVDKPTITGDAIKEYQRLAMGKRAIVRGVSIKHSQHIAEQFNKAGIPARHVDGTTPEAERDEAMESFKRGDTLILSNVDLFSEGVDVPSVECVIDLRPTTSLILWLQFCGRALRPSPGKEYAIIIDHAGNAFRHGLPCDERTWSLEGRKKEKNTDTGPKVKLCPECFMCMASWRKECPGCKHTFVVEAREVEHVKGELSEVDLEAVKKARRIEQGKAKDINELIAIGKSRNYRNPVWWAKNVLKAREKMRKKASEW